MLTVWCRCGDDVFLIDQGRHKLETVEPDDGLLVVAVRPERMEDIVGTDSQRGVIAEEPPPNPLRVLIGCVLTICTPPESMFVTK
jgi:hypothetical protein